MQQIKLVPIDPQPKIVCELKDKATLKIAKFKLENNIVFCNIDKWSNVKGIEVDNENRFCWVVESK